MLMGPRDATAVLDVLNQACQGGSEVPVTVVIGDGNRVWRVGKRHLICVFDDVGEWDYIAWVADGQWVWRYDELPESVKHWTPSDEARKRVFHWTE